MRLTEPGFPTARGEASSVFGQNLVYRTLWGLRALRVAFWVSLVQGFRDIFASVAGRSIGCLGHAVTTGELTTGLRQKAHSHLA